MKPISPVLAALTALCLALPIPAEAFSGRRDTRAYPISDVAFEVIARTAGSADVYWCGASDYARRVLNAPWSAKIHVLRGRGPSVTTGRRTAVQFTLDAQAVPPQPRELFFVLNRLRPGDRMSVQQAATHCAPPPVRP
ncbi:hypothetical protein E1832_03075 [Antarcticimicrobium luteum]|uniref:Secreted protein n=2 Tax=Antarcticimicrobium luteum TaxID=2547397 RepID=A0A4R5VHE8_9RHOB|nr:hypothetical protein E1832_03075 [Antarcticimicrobium luteum]